MSFSAADGPLYRENCLTIYNIQEVCFYDCVI